ncbi:MAG TPA: hypothetical protein VMU99_04690 [Acidimicrobiales bacterium]|nr:hypothetical protein [Acidimicrobiales bacterium]
MSVGDAGGSGEVWCEFTITDGVTTQVGRFDLVRGYGAWDVPLHAGRPRDIRRVSSMQVM